MQKKLNEQALKGYGSIKEDLDKGLPHKDMRMLWLFDLYYEEYEDFRVTSIVWNPCNHELIALGLSKNRPSKFDKGDIPKDEPDHFKDEGAVLIYSLKNPKLPENIIRTESSVMTIDFSSLKP